ncbi:efflux RND transporter periplasmic adaptor subunit [Marinicella rhabdoformis]|uniref:efflux RND transporter periplasmic adaptor subunit n=1 Tax=Marinicella rhabdoformis TaxID=2580566 RepID=UPI0012AEBFD2|nr:efflux RND transporter periplasmic adaptor subunit [Marinicella rhabdoformis]
MQHIQNQTKPSLLKRIMPFFLILAVFIVLMIVMSMFKKPPAVVPDRPSGFLVETATLKRNDLNVMVNSQGSVKAKREIALMSEISGKVRSLNDVFVVGGQFAAGDVLVSIDDADYRVSVQRAKANLASAQANLDLEQAKSDQALKDWKSFGKQGKPSDLVLNIPQLNGAKASVKAALADVAKAERDLAKTQIIAPFDGTVLTKSIDIGQYVNMAGQLGTIASTAVAEVRLPLTASDISKLKLSKINLNTDPIPVQFTASNTDDVIEGLLTRLESAKDSKTLLNYAVAEINQPLAKGLYFNTFLSAQIQGESLTDVFAVPAAWMMANNQIAVYRNGQLEILDLNVVHKTDDYFYVSSGLSEKNQIVITPIQAPEAGMTLRLKGEQVKAEKVTETTESQS